MSNMEYDVVNKAESTILSLKERNPRTNKDEIRLTKSQIRKFLTAVNGVKNKVDTFKSKNMHVEKLDDDLAGEVKFLKVNILYQAGRERIVKDFVLKAELPKIIDDIGTDIKKFEKFCKYLEALVAFHKYYGGRD